MTNIETLLKQISEIVVKERTQQEEKRIRGENFNVFSVLGLSTSEVRLHSAFLGELLNPNGDHGLGDGLLKAFVDTIIKQVDPKFEIDTKTCKVSVEYPIGEISEDYTEGGRIDLLIRDDNNHAIIIENKINAGDQYKQLLRYQNFAKKNSLKYVLLYLTLDSKEASEYSTNNQVDYFRISYKEYIYQWLNHCISIAALFPRVRETIAQYQTNLNIITRNMSEINKQSMLELLTNEANIDATLEIISLSEDIGRTIRMNFIESVLRELAEKHNMRFSYDKDFVALGTRNLNYKDICFKLHGYDKCYFQIQNESNTVYYGIVADGYPESHRKVVGQFEGWTDGINISWPYGFKLFPGNMRWWDGIDSLTDMVKGTKIKDIIDNELTKIIEHHLIEDYSKIMDNKLANINQTEE
jgi:hypothetical protein